MPIKLLLHYSIWDVRIPEKRKMYPYAILVNIVFLALLAEAMIECVMRVGYMMGANPTIMGLTFAAVGTSLPNIWSAMLVARQGDGDTAVSCALGSNTFNIYIGLACPWLAWTLIYGKPYYGIQDSGIVVLLLILIWVILIYCIVIILHGWELRMWMAPVMNATYISIIIYCISTLG